MTSPFVREEVFAAITDHNNKLGNQDKFSTKPLTLVYRASNVQNMRFVDTPGIIANQGVNYRNVLAIIFMLNIPAAAHCLFNSIMKSTGKDNREDIKSILRDSMKKPNSKLCELVEPKEFSTNAIINFCDETFGGKGKWVNNAIALMTKFDKQLEDSRSGSKANTFFSKYHENNLFPYLTITPTLDREDLNADELFLKRQQLLESSLAYEEGKFADWMDMHTKYRETDPGDSQLSSDVSSRVGFSVTASKMRAVMLTDTTTRLPEVLISLRKELVQLHVELEVLKEKKKFRDPTHLKVMVWVCL
jgi:hypothetical protein